MFILYTLVATHLSSSEGNGNKEARFLVLGSSNKEARAHSNLAVFIGSGKLLWQLDVTAWYNSKGMQSLALSSALILSVLLVCALGS